MSRELEENFYVQEDADVLGCECKFLRVYMSNHDAALLKKVSQLITFFKEGKIEVLEKHEMHPGLEKGSRENYLYFTLAPSLNFQRNSPALWQAAYNTFIDAETHWVFLPELVVQKSMDELQGALLRYKLALQKNKHTAIWKNISTTFHLHYKSDPRVLLAAHDWDIPKILHAVQIEHKKAFPYLSGLKLSNYWLFILSHFTDANFANLHELSIIPDTHIMQSSVKLGVVDLKASPTDVDRVWRRINQLGNFSPVELHSVLWNWSRSGFLPSIE